MPYTRLFWWLFVIVSGGHLIGTLLPNELLVTISKPLLMPLLLAWLLASTPNALLRRFRSLVITGLIFSTLGDVLLINKGNPAFFLLGLVSFLIAHVQYIRAFLGYPGSKKGTVLLQLWYIFPFLCFLVFYNVLLYPRIATELRFPVIFYSCVIIIMAMSALNLWRLVSRPAAYAFLSGALLFVASDSLLAFDKFYDPTAIPYARFFIMITYILGQYFITYGTMQIVKKG